MIRAACRAVPLLAILAGASQAQGSIELLAGYVHNSPGGDFSKAGQAVDAGRGLDLALVGPWKSWVAAVGIQSTKHPVDYDPTVEDEAKLRMIHVYGELRKAFPLSTRVEPYVGARIGLHSMWNPTAFTSDLNERVEGDATQKGPMIGLSAGATVRLARWFRLYASAGYSYAFLGDIDFEGSKIGGSSVSGPLTALRVGGMIDFSRPQQ